MRATAGDIGKRIEWDFIRYANVWEDAGILCEALRAGPGKRLLSIASAGDNCFSLLAKGADVVAADLNPAQLACVELKAAAIRALDHAAFLRFIGIHGGGDRLDVYRGLRDGVSSGARGFWDARPGLLKAGIVHAGKFERYFQLFRTRILPLVHGRQAIDELLQPRDAEGRRRFYDTRWNNRRWRLMFRFFFSRWVMGRLGRDPEFFRYVEGSVAERILARTKFALTELTTHDNPYLGYILEGNYSRALPPYLEPDTYERLRGRVGALTLHQGTVEEAGEKHAGAGFDGFNLSDIFEYLDPQTSAKVYGGLLRVARPGARFAYWNMLVPRKAPEALRGSVTGLTDLAARLFARDRAFFYSAFVVEERKPDSA